MKSPLIRNTLLVAHTLNVRLAPFYTAQDTSELTRRVLVAAVTGAVALFLALQSGLARAGDRVYLTKTQIEASLAGKAIVSKNIASGQLSHWEFRSDGTVEAASRWGRASGTWTIRDDGQACVRLMGQTGCRYWFRQGGAYANADSNRPDAPVVAEVHYD